MCSYIFIFGNTPRLSRLELGTIYSDKKIIDLNESIAFIEDLSDFSPLEAMHTVAGTVKIARFITKLKDLSAQALAEVLLPFVQGKHLTFGISCYGGVSVSKDMMFDVKKYLENSVGHVRFVESSGRDALSSVVIKKENICELVILTYDNAYFIGKTEAVQTFEEWGRRDFDRPFVDPKAGMLPPKVARMVANIGLGKYAKEKLLLDPFCGMGTILMEGLLRGAQCLGSDQSDKAIQSTNKNLVWLLEQYPIISPSQYRVFVSDASHVSETVQPLSVDCIVTEPYMGSTRLISRIGQTYLRDKVKNIVKGLEKLYIGCLKDWIKVLKPNGKVVIALPEFCIGNNRFFVKKVIDSCEMLGYTTLAGPIEYSRQQAIVKRQFYIFQKNII